MNDRELMQMALDALETVTAKMLECRDELAEYGGRPKSTGHKQRLWDSSHDVYVDNAIPAAEAIRTRLAQGDTETEQLSELVQILDKGEKHMKATDTTNGVPMFPEGTRVYSHVFYNPDKPKTVLHAVWRGAEYYYTLINDEGVVDEGYLAKDLSVAAKH